jgi:hypothetical protein
LKTAIDDYDENLNVGDRVVISDNAGALIGEAGTISSLDSLMTLYYGTDVVFVLLDSGERIRAFPQCLIKSPYQNEPLEVVPNV